jgi:membrane-associated phospholipid phosphatase
MKQLIVALMLSLLPVGLYAQAWGPIDTYFTPKFVLPQQDQKYAQWFSDGTTAFSIGLDTLHSWRSPHRLAAFGCQAERDGLILGISTFVKYTTGRMRPDLSDNQSFFSEHTAFTAASFGGPRFAFVFPLTLGTAAGRVSGNKHYATDVIVGGFFGAIVGYLTRDC